MDLTDLVHAAAQERQPMRMLVRFILLGAVLYGVAALRRSQPAEVSTATSDERKLLAAAIARGIGDDDVVVQRRLLETAHQVALTAESDTSVLADGDPIIEGRLVQQMRLQLETDARRDEPTEVELRDYLHDHAQRFVTPERVRLEQVFFSTARRGVQTADDARDALREMRREGDAPSPPRVVHYTSSDPSIWPAQLPLQTVGDLEKIFGSAARQIMAAPADQWTGPYQSPLGYHLVRVLERAPASMPSFESVRTAVRLALLNDRAEQHIQRVLPSLLPAGALP